jgi:hypothetical protein
MIESISRTSSGDGPMCRREKSLGSKSAEEALTDIVFTLFQTAVDCGGTFHAIIAW